MTTASTTHCPTCAAPIREESSKFCAFCGTKLPEPEGPIHVVVESQETRTQDRLAAAAAHPSIPELIAFTPWMPPPPTQFTIQPWVIRLAGSVIALGGLGLAALGVASLILLARREQDPSGGVVLIVFGMLGFLVGVATFPLSYLWRPTPAKPAPELQRFIAIVVGERTETTGSQYGTSTRYYVTFEFAGGERREYPVGGPFAGTIKENDVGMVYVRGANLLEFRRLAA
ncbi:MAG: DUF2500 family protein [Planctomycetota bacterium]